MKTNRLGGIISETKYMVRFVYRYYMVDNPYPFEEEEGYFVCDSLDECQNNMKKFEGYDIYSVDYFKLIPRRKPTRLDGYEKDKKYVISFELTDGHDEWVEYEDPGSFDVCEAVIQNYLDEEFPYMIGTITWYDVKPVMGRFEWKED